MNKPKMIILADIGSLRVTCIGFQQIVASLQDRFDVVACKFYSYVAKRNRDYNEYIAANGFDTSLPSASRRRNKLDSRQVMDAAEIAKSGTSIGAIAMITGEGDILPVVNLLKQKGIDIYDVNVKAGKYTDIYSGFIPVPLSALREGYTAPAMKAAAPKKAPKPVVQPVRQTQQPAATIENPHLAEARSILDRFRK
jgi:hypothetical protein